VNPDPQVRIHSQSSPKKFLIVAKTFQARIPGWRCRGTVKLIVFGDNIWDEYAIKIINPDPRFFGQSSFSHLQSYRQNCFDLIDGLTNVTSNTLKCTLINLPIGWPYSGRAGWRRHDVMLLSRMSRGFVESCVVVLVRWLLLWFGSGVDWRVDNG